LHWSEGVRETNICIALAHLVHVLSPLTRETDRTISGRLVKKSGSAYQYTHVLLNNKTTHKR
jgi:hypothetical protein